MSEEIFVNVTPMETRVAVVENGALMDVHIERSARRGLVGNIYAGKVVRVLPGMQAAFIEIGSERSSFLHVSDIAPMTLDGKALPKSESIHDYLHDGKTVVVQVTKDPLGSKGARLTTHLSFSSRYLVYMPMEQHVGISQQIDEEGERQRLQHVMHQALEQEGLQGAGGFIIRTAAEGVEIDEMRVDLRYLQRVWAAIRRRASESRKSRKLYEDLPLFKRTVRDLARPGLERVRVDSLECFEELTAFCTDYVPEVTSLLEHYPGERPLFDIHGIEDEMSRALGRKVELKSGGYLIIDQTEAMTTIDVNTGSFVGRRNLEETSLKTNLEAAQALARQLRVRNLGGIIIVDFIDMKEEHHRRQVHRALEKAMAHDPARNAITGVSELGLIEMTRKRTRESLEHVLCEDCPVCQGRGVLKSADTVCYEIFREIMRDAKAYENDTIIVLCAQEVADRLLDEESATVADLEEFSGKTINFRVEPMYSREQFDIVLT